jgi:hypothetical protein
VTTAPRRRVQRERESSLNLICDTEHGLPVARRSFLHQRHNDRHAQKRSKRDHERTDQRPSEVPHRSDQLPAHETYLLNSDPMELKAWLRKLAREPMPAVAANATSARTKTYSTNTVQTHPCANERGYPTRTSWRSSPQIFEPARGATAGKEKSLQILIWEWRVRIF